MKKFRQSLSLFCMILSMSMANNLLAAPIMGAYKYISLGGFRAGPDVISTIVSGVVKALGADMNNIGMETVSVAFANGECGNERWGGIPGKRISAKNAPLFAAARIKFIISTGGAGGVFTCGTDQGLETFIQEWNVPGFLGIDFDIEHTQTQAQIDNIVKRLIVAHAKHPSLRFNFTLATIAGGNSTGVAKSLGANAPQSLGAAGVRVMNAIMKYLGFKRNLPATWPNYVTINLMVMDYGRGTSVCVMQTGKQVCDMGQSAVQAAYNLRDYWKVPFAFVELTPMIGLNDTGLVNVFSIGSRQTKDRGDIKVLTSFVKSNGLYGIHYWSYDRDTDCASTIAQAGCNSMGKTYAGKYGYFRQFKSCMAGTCL